MSDLFIGSAIDNPFFRKDYTYLPEAKAFYKLNNAGLNWVDAKKRCAFEGAVLWVPETSEEVAVVTKFWLETSKDTLLIYVGINDLISEGYFETIDGMLVLVLSNYTYLC